MSKHGFHIVKEGDEKHLFTIAPIPFLLVIFSNPAQSKMEREWAFVELFANNAK